MTSGPRPSTLRPSSTSRQTSTAAKPVPCPSPVRGGHTAILHCRFLSQAVGILRMHEDGAMKNDITAPS